MNEPTPGTEIDAEFIETLRRCQPTVPSQTPETFYRAGWSAALQSQGLEMEHGARSTGRQSVEQTARRTQRWVGDWSRIAVGLMGLSVGILVGLVCHPAGFQAASDRFSSLAGAVGGSPGTRDIGPGTTALTHQSADAPNSPPPHLSGPPASSAGVAVPMSELKIAPGENLGRNLSKTTRRSSQLRLDEWGLLSPSTWAVVTGATPEFWRRLAQPLPKQTLAPGRHELTLGNYRRESSFELEPLKAAIFAPNQPVPAGPVATPSPVILRSRPLSEENWQDWN